MRGFWVYLGDIRHYLCISDHFSSLRTDGSSPLYRGYKGCVVICVVHGVIIQQTEKNAMTTIVPIQAATEEY